MDQGCPITRGMSRSWRWTERIEVLLTIKYYCYYHFNNLQANIRSYRYNYFSSLEGAKSIAKMDGDHGRIGLPLNPPLP